MSVGDVRGFKRRLRLLEQRGHAPKRAGLSLGESIARQKAQADKATRGRPAGKAKR